MAAKSVLLVDSDARSQRVLEVSLKKAGFEVMCAKSVDDALTLASESVPEVVLTEADLAGGTGFDLARRLRDDARTKSTAIVFLAQDGSPESKIRAISAGADDYLTKPMFVKEILTRLGGLLERRQKEALSKKDRPANFSGTLGGMGLVDLFQLIETGRKTCALLLSSDHAQSGGFVESGVASGAIYFKDGRAVDAELGRLRGEPAIYRFLLWDDGAFEVDFVPPERPAVTVSTPTQALLLEGMRRIDEWTRIAATLPSLNTRLDVDFRALGQHAATIPEEVDGVVRLFDGRRSILHVLNESPADDLATLSIVSRLLADHILSDQRGSRASQPAAPISLESWLTTKPSHAPPAPTPEPPGEDFLANLPSELGAAMIPSLETPSQILAAVDPRIQETRPPEQMTARPEPLPDEAPHSSAILSRSTVPATASLMPAQPAPATQAGPAKEGEPRRVSLSPSAPVDPSGARLTVRRVGSSILPPAAAVTASAPAPVATPEPRASSDILPDAGDAIVDAFDAGDSIIDSAPTTPAGARPRRQPRGATFRTVRRSTVTKPANGASEVELDGEAAEVEDDTITTHVVASPQPSPQPSPSSEVTPIFEDAVPPPPPPITQIPTREEAPDPFRAPPPRAPALVAAPAQARSPSELDADFAKLRQTYEEHSAAEGSHWSRWLIAVGLVGMAFGWYFIFVGDHQRPRAEKPPVISPVPITANPTPAWPTIGDETSTAAPGKAKTSTAAIKTVPPVAVTAPAPAPAGPTPEDQAELDKALASLKSRRFDAAKNAYTKLIERLPSNADAHAGLAHALYELQSGAAAQTEAKKALELSPSSARANLVLGLIAYDRQKNQEATGYFKRYLELAPTGEHASDVRAILKSQ